MRRPLQRACAILTVACGAMVAACGARGDGQHLEVERGRQLLARYHCGTCHSIPGVPASQGRLAASLEGYGKRSYIAGRVANEPAALAAWIIDPASVVPGTLMPNMGVSPTDARDMAAYLGQLR
jgi:cytochrome c2